MVVTAVDAALTILHPSRRGPITTASGRLTFEAVRRPARALGRPDLLSGAGAAAVIANLLAWVVLLWIGWALIYLPYMDDLSYAPSVEYADHDLWEALYFSGMSLSTVGFGDIVAATDVLRIVSVAEAATGFGVMTAAITYVLSLIPRVSSGRVAARSVNSQMHDPGKAAAMVEDASYLLALHDQVLTVDEQTERFPILYYFRSDDQDASIYTFVRGALAVCLQARWGVSEQRVPHARRYGEELQQALVRMTDHYAKRFMHRHGPEALEQPLDHDEARRLLEHLAAAAGDAGVTVSDVSDDELQQLADFAGRSQTFLGHLADHHLRDHEPLAPSG